MANNKAEELVKGQFSSISAEGTNKVTTSARKLQKKMQMESDMFVEVLLRSSNAYKVYYGLRKAFRSEGIGNAYPVRCCVVEGQRLLMPDVKTDVEAAFFRLRLVTKKGLTHFGGLYAVDFEEQTYTLYNVQYLEEAAGEEKEEVLKGRELVMVRFDDVQALEAAYIPLSAVLDTPENGQDLSAFFEAHSFDIAKPKTRGQRLAVASTLLQLRPFFPYTALRLAMETVEGLYITRDVQNTMKHRMLLPLLAMKSGEYMELQLNEEEERWRLNDPSFRLFLKQRGASASVSMEHVAVQQSRVSGAFATHGTIPSLPVSLHYPYSEPPFFFPMPFVW